MTDKIDCVVIGAGVVGLAVARALALAGRETLIAERELTFGSGVSARNSEVILAGIYSPPGSLKSRLCVAGRSLLYDYCRERGIAFIARGPLAMGCWRDIRGGGRRPPDRDASLDAPGDFSIDRQRPVSVAPPRPHRHAH